MASVKERCTESMDQRANEPERRYCKAANLRLEGDGAERTLVGYAAMFDSESVPLHGWTEHAGFIEFTETIARGAFAEAIQRDDVKANVQHEGGLSVIGRLKNGRLKLAEDETGLRVTIRPTNTNAGRDAIALVEDGTLDQMSFAWDRTEDEWKPPADGGLWQRRITKISGLRDVSVVSDPAYPATVVHVRNWPGIIAKNEDFTLSTERARMRLDLELAVGA